MSAKSSKCPRCNEKSNTLKKRFYSDKAAALLVNLGEIKEGKVDEPICQFCYLEIRDLLVDESISTPLGDAPVGTPSKKPIPTKTT